MTSPDVAGAREWAKGYLAWLLREHRYLFDESGAYLYRRNTLQATLDLHMVNGAYQLTGLPALFLPLLAEKHAAAYDLMTQVIAQNTETGAPLPTGWDDLLKKIDNGSLPRPKDIGRPEDNAARGLIFKIMCSHMIEEYGLKVMSGKKKPTVTATTACLEIIIDVFGEAGLPIHGADAIYKAMDRWNGNDLIKYPEDIED